MRFFEIFDDLRRHCSDKKSFPQNVLWTWWDYKFGFKILPNHYDYYVANLINALFKFRYFPNEWNEAGFGRFKKSGEAPLQTRTYGHFNSLTVLSNLTEVIFLRRLYLTYLNNLASSLNIQPHTNCLLRIFEYIHYGLDNSEYVCSLFIHVAKAFDPLWLSDLIYELLKFKVSTAHVTFASEYCTTNR